MLVNQLDLAITHVEALSSMNYKKLKAVPITIASAYCPCKFQLYTSPQWNNLYTYTTTHNLYKPTVSQTYIKLRPDICHLSQHISMRLPIFRPVDPFPDM